MGYGRHETFDCTRRREVRAAVKRQRDTDFARVPNLTNVSTQNPHEYAHRHWCTPLISFGSGVFFDGSLKDVNGLIKRTRTRWYVQVKQAASLEDLTRDTMNYLDFRR